MSYIQILTLLSICDDNFEADKIRYLYNITKFDSNVSQKGGGLKIFYQSCVIKIFLVPPCILGGFLRFSGTIVAIGENFKGILGDTTAGVNYFWSTAKSFTGMSNFVRI